MVAFSILYIESGSKCVYIVFIAGQKDLYIYVVCKGTLLTVVYKGTWVALDSVISYADKASTCPVLSSRGQKQKCFCGFVFECFQALSIKKPNQQFVLKRTLHYWDIWSMEELC